MYQKIVCDSLADTPLFMSSTEQDAASGEITQVIQNTDGAFPYPVLPGPCGIRNPYLLPFRQKR
ncbi:conserved domain protein [Prevotella denticola CRIS 18C-A]|uniref:Conserved domain protein n=1 Tax=Prevotella denticola CRIS 18C-A TaxID=944557 RepID=F0H6S9_9BACT|nr:conserved domain protein [Prevotella denticola CRIS 18C-A]